MRYGVDALGSGLDYTFLTDVIAMDLYGSGHAISYFFNSRFIINKTLLIRRSRCLLGPFTANTHVRTWSIK